MLKVRAVYGQDRFAGLVVAIPLEDSTGAPIRQSRIRKVLRTVAQTRLIHADEQGVYTLSGTRRTTWLAPVEGGVVIGTRRDVLVDAVAGEGNSWVDDELVAMANVHPVAARVRHQDRDVLVGAHTHEGGWEVQVDEPEQTRRTVERMTALLLGSAGQALSR